MTAKTLLLFPKWFFMTLGVAGLLYVGVIVLLVLLALFALWLLAVMFGGYSKATVRAMKSGAEEEAALLARRRREEFD